MPRSLLWHSANNAEFPGVRVFAQRMKDAILAAHDAILAARIKQTDDANRRRSPAPFTAGDLVYLSTTNLSLPKARARKLVPKYIGPYRILLDNGNNSYRLDLPSVLKQRGVHPVFHASLLRVHVPNDDRRFPGRQLDQLTAFNEAPTEWQVRQFVDHTGAGNQAIFKVEWSSGDFSWLPFHEVAHLSALPTYLEAQGIEDVDDLPGKTCPVSPTPPLEVQTSAARLDIIPTSPLISREHAAYLREISCYMATVLPVPFAMAPPDSDEEKIDWGDDSDGAPRRRRHAFTTLVSCA